MKKMDVLDKNDMEQLKMASEDETGLEIYYSAHTDYMNEKAKVVFIGICPGFEQMKLSFDLLKEHADLPEQEILKEAKIGARFGTSMRRNLIELADRTLLPQVLSIDSCSKFFDKDCTIMDNTALLPYPVFRNGRNYTGHTPKIARSPLLRGICKKQLEKIRDTYPDAVFIPLGKCVDEEITRSRILDDQRVIHGFPHPSGANGHRFKQLENNLEQINASICSKLAENHSQADSGQL